MCYTLFKMAIKIVAKKRFFVFGFVTLALVGLLIFLGIKFFPSEFLKNLGINQSSEETKGETHLYEALVQPFGEKPENPLTQENSALSQGEVVVIFPEGHLWSETEKTSYLILRLNITEEEAQQLVEAETQGIDLEETKTEEGTAPLPLKRETLRARKYRLKLEELNFDLQKFWENPTQPYENQIFDSLLIEEKIEIKNET